MTLVNLTLVLSRSIQKELDLIKTPQSRSKKRKREEVENDAYMVLECYRRIQDHLQRLNVRLLRSLLRVHL